MIKNRRFKDIGCYRGTVRIFSQFDPESDAIRMFKAIRNDIDDVIELSSSRSMPQRMEIASIYESVNGIKLVTDLKRRVTSRKFLDLLMALYTTPEMLDAQYVHDVLRDRRSHVKLIEILKTRSASEMELIKILHEDKYQITLESAIARKVDGRLKHFYLSIINNTATKPFKSSVTESVIDFHNGMKGEDAMTIVEEVFSRCSLEELKTILDEYSERWGTSIESEILSKFEGAFCKALLLIIKMARNLPLYYAEKMFACVTKTSINHQRLSGLIVSRCEIDMIDIKGAFRKEYEMTLDNFVKNNAKHNFRRSLQSLIRT